MKREQPWATGKVTSSLFKKFNNRQPMKILIEKNVSFLLLMRIIPNTS